MIMDNDKLKLLIQELKSVVAALESEVYSDPDSYCQHTFNIDLEGVLNYKQSNDDDSEEGL